MRKLLLISLFLFFLASGEKILTSHAQQTIFTPNCAGSNDTARFTAIISTIGSNQGTIQLPYKNGTRCAVNNLTIPANITLDNTQGTGIKINTGQTLTPLGAILNPPNKPLFYNALSGQGTVSFVGNNAVPFFRPEWWSTNARLGAQAALNAINTAGGGTLHFGYGVYSLTGTVDPTTHAALFLPQNSTGIPIRYVIEGECMGATSAPVTAMQTRCTVLDAHTMSDVDGAGDNSAILAGSAWASAGTINNYVAPVVRNLTFRNADNPRLGGIQFHNVMTAELEGVVVDTGVSPELASQPTHIRYGIQLPTQTNNVDIRLTNTVVLGHYVGYLANEHTIFVGRNTASFCLYGLSAEGGLGSISGTFFAAEVPHPVSGTGILDLTLDVERWDTACASGCSYTSSEYSALFQGTTPPTPSGTTPVWYQSIQGKDIEGSTPTSLKGRVTYKLEVGNVAANQILPFSTTNTDFVQLINLTVPIVQAAVHATTSQTGLVSGTSYVVGFGAEDWDTVGGSDNAIYELHRTDSNNGRFTFGRSGEAHVCASLIWDGLVTPAGYLQVLFRLNGTTIIDYAQVPDSADNPTVSKCIDYPVVNGDYVEIMAKNISGSNRALVASGMIHSTASVIVRPTQ